MNPSKTRKILVLFGATGNLVRTKILPALYQLEKQRLLPEDFVCLAIGRQEITSKELLEQACIEEKDPNTWNHLDLKFRYCKLQIDNQSTYSSLKKELDSLGKTSELLFFLAVSTTFFSIITKNLVFSSCWQNDRSSLFLEKPFGGDLASANDLKKELDDLVGLENIRLIDHYLLKPGIGSLLEVRNLPQVASLWNRQKIQSIQVIATESVGIEKRAPFYDRQGQVKDLVQSHLLQILTLAGFSLEKDQIPQKAQEDFLSSLFLSETCPVQIGQYIKGKVGESLVCGYLDEIGVGQDSQTETFSMMRFESSLPEWEGVFFEICTGKRLEKKITAIIVLFHSGERFIIQSAPKICIINSPPGTEKECHLLEEKWRKSLSGYESILMSCLSMENEVFLSLTKSSLGWKVLSSYFRTEYPLHPYEAGSWGPSQALTDYSSIFHYLKRA